MDAVKHKANIIVVDDEEDVIQMLSRGLERQGYRVASCTSGEECIEKVKNEKFDIAVLDIVLPGINGIETLERIKSLDPEIETIMITGHGTIGVIIETMRKGAIDFIDKPITSQKIVEAVEATIRRHRLKETVALHEISKAIFSSASFEELLKTIIDVTLTVLRADGSSIMLFDENNNLYIAYSYGIDIEIAKKTRLAIGERIAGWVAQNKKPLVLINGLVNDSRFKDIEQREEIKSSLVIPLKKDTQLIGILSANRTTLDENFSPSDIYKADIFFSFVSLALDNAQLHLKLKRLTASTAGASEGASFKKALSHLVHEVNNPLMVISGRTQLSLMEKIQNEDVKKNLNIIFEECKRAKEILEQARRQYKPPPPIT